VPALLATALTGLLVSPISWDHHWVWIAPAIAVAAHYAVAAARSAPIAAPTALAPFTEPPALVRARRVSRSLWALAAFLLVAFAAWPDAIWEGARTLGNFSLGFLWAQANTNPQLFAEHGDQPQYVEYHWHGFQLLWGNTYVLAGVALLVMLLAVGWRLRNKVAPRAEAAGRDEAPAPVITSH
jgi:alpha-1,2-mannosyltransferase